MRRRTFLNGVTAGTLSLALGRGFAAESQGVSVPDVIASEDAFAYIQRVKGSFNETLYKQLLGAANEFKEGDEIVGIAAADLASRGNARKLLANATIGGIDKHPPHRDGLFKLLNETVDAKLSNALSKKTLGQLKWFLLEKTEPQIKTLMPGLSSDVIGCVVKLMSNQELIAVGSKIFNPLPGSGIGARGYLGARIQPNSPTDNVDDIRWQVFDGWSYGVGDVVLGTNPVSSDPASVLAIERTLKDVLTTCELAHVIPQCVLSHIDVQAEVEQTDPGSTALWFQSIAGCDNANKTFDISVEKMAKHAATRDGQYGLYFETGQGADFTNGHSHGFDMVLHESRKYGFARALTQQVAAAQTRAGSKSKPWVHLNDVAGFIGPEVFRTKEQLVRCCLEDIVMGKLHGLCIGLDVCSTLHMDVSLDDLDWCLNEIMPANPAYLMALPTKIDPMLGYLTTGFQDHVRLRERFGYKVDDRVWNFFQNMNIVNAKGQPSENFADPIFLYIQYQRRKGDGRPEAEIRAEGQRQLAEVRGRGVFIAEGHGRKSWDLAPKLKTDITRIYDEAKESIWAELKPEFIESIPDAFLVTTRSADRNDYILHPESGEQLTDRSNRDLTNLRKKQNGKTNLQIVISDGLNALSIMQKGHLAPFLKQLRQSLVQDGYRPAKENIVVNSGRVRAGYRIGETLYGNLPNNRAILHIIGERPGTGHYTFSIYITAPNGQTWGKSGEVDHNITKVVSGVASTALEPTLGALETVKILNQLV
ncbi:MAG: ethanolamine ammonia-lyase [Planctomycetaceae bacterium]|nr:ethanolamine ammonia-lyase [Planctomycetaceae bacterium]